jgi:hypothetical protein
VSASLRFRQNYPPDSGAMRRENFFFNAADRKNQARQGNFAGHRRIRANSFCPCKASESRSHRHARARTVFRNRARRNVQMNAVAFDRFGSIPNSEACDHRYERAACADSFITSPSCPVKVKPPPPGKPSLR